MKTSIIFCFALALLTASCGPSLKGNPAGFRTSEEVLFRSIDTEYNKICYVTVGPNNRAISCVKP